jgi:hypothetical protein
MEGFERKEVSHEKILTLKEKHLIILQTIFQIVRIDLLPAFALQARADLF